MDKYAARQKASTPQADRHPSALEIAWAAGFIEGEAHIGAQVSVAQVNREPLERLQAIFGGHLVLGPNRYPDNPQWHRQWIWRVSGARARGVMMTIHPMLSDKHKERVRRVVLAWRSYESKRKPSLRPPPPGIAVGTRTAKAKLTDEQVIAIRQLYASGTVTQLEIARRYGMVQSSIGAILRRESWRHLPAVERTD